MHAAAGERRARRAMRERGRRSGDSAAPARACSCGGTPLLRVARGARTRSRSGAPAPADRGPRRPPAGDRALRLEETLPVRLHPRHVVALEDGRGLVLAIEPAAELPGLPRRTHERPQLLGKEALEAV